MSAKKQVTGEAIYTDDIPPVTGELQVTIETLGIKNQAYLATSDRAIGKIKSIDISKAKKYPGTRYLPLVMTGRCQGSLYCCGCSW